MRDLFKTLRHNIGHFCGGKRKKKRPVSMHSVVQSVASDTETEETILPDNKYIRVLIAEDNIISLNIMKRMLSLRCNIVVETVSDGTLALELATSNTRHRGKDPFSLIILDVHMPGLSGVDVIRGIRKRNIDVPILIVTADSAIGAKCTRVGANAILVKPVKKAELLKIIDNLVCPIELETEENGATATASRVREQRPLVT